MTGWHPSSRSVAQWTVAAGVLAALTLAYTVFHDSMPNSQTSASAPTPSALPALVPESASASATRSADPAQPEASTTTASKEPTTTPLSKVPVVGAHYEHYISPDDPTFVGFVNGLVDSGGKTIDDSLYVEHLFFDEEAYVDYNLSQKYSSLDLIAAVSDAAPTSAKLRFRIFLDDTPANKVDVSFGKPVSLHVRTKGALRLRISLIRLDRGNLSYQAGWGDAKLQAA
jgi:hypothetical protein